MYYSWQPALTPSRMSKLNVLEISYDVTWFVPVKLLYLIGQNQSSLQTSSGARYKYKCTHTGSGWNKQSYNGSKRSGA